MNETEAREIAEAVTASLRQESYATLVGRLLGNAEIQEKSAESGTRYQVEIQAFWDSKDSGDLRVLVSVDDGGIRWLKPLTTDFIMAPDDSFVGE